MNENFFQKNYSEKLRSGDSQHMQKDEYVYAVNKTNMKLLLVIDDVTDNYNAVKCIDFLDEGIMTKHNYYLDSDINYISTFNSLYHFYEKNRFSFTLEEIDHEKIISSLRKVFYFLQPLLDSRTCAGGGESNTITDQNFYEGHYFLKNGEEYTILKHRDMLYFYNGNVSYYNYIMKKQEEISGYIYRETIDFDLYSKAIKLHKLKNEIIFYTSERLDYRYIELKNSIEEYGLLKTELEQIEY